MSRATVDPDASAPLLRRRRLVWAVGLAVACGALAAWRVWRVPPMTPDPFGSIEQVYAFLPERQRRPRLEDGRIPFPMGHRRNAALGRFSGAPHEVEPFVAFLESMPVPVATPITEEYIASGRSETATSLRAVAHAWAEADFSELRERILAVAVAYAEHPDGLIAAQAGLVLLAMEHDMPSDDPVADAAKALLGGRFGESFRATWGGVIEHARSARPAAGGP